MQMQLKGGYMKEYDPFHIIGKAIVKLANSKYW